MGCDPGACGLAALEEAFSALARSLSLHAASASASAQSPPPQRPLALAQQPSPGDEAAAAATLLLLPASLLEGGAGSSIASRARLTTGQVMALAKLLASLSTLDAVHRDGDAAAGAARNMCGSKSQCAPPPAPLNSDIHVCCRKAHFTRIVTMLGDELRTAFGVRDQTEVGAALDVRAAIALVRHVWAHSTLNGMVRHLSGSAGHHGAHSEEVHLVLSSAGTGHSAPARDGAAATPRTSHGVSALADASQARAHPAYPESSDYAGGPDVAATGSASLPESATGSLSVKGSCSASVGGHALATATATVSGGRAAGLLGPSIHSQAVTALTAFVSSVPQSLSPSSTGTRGAPPPAAAPAADTGSSPGPSDSEEELWSREDERAHRARESLQLLQHLLHGYPSPPPCPWPSAPQAAPAPGRWQLE